MFGADLSDVRFHDDAASSARARDYGAKAFTVGNDVYLDGPGARLGTGEGDRVVAHEVAHVLQLRRGRSGAAQAAASGPAYRYPSPATPSPTAAVSRAGDAVEQNAEAAADAAIAGRPFELLAAPAGTLYRAVTTQCIAPSEIVNQASAANFGRVAETVIEADYCTVMGCSPFATDFFDLGGWAAPYLAFLAAHNPVSAATIARWAVQVGLSGGVLIPDVLTDLPARKDYYEIKPNSIDGRPAGAAKLIAIDAFMSFNSLPYVPGTSYTPTPMIPIPLVGPTMSALLNMPAAAACGPINASLEVVRPGPGLVLYRVCLTADWACWAAVMALEALLALLIVIIIETAPIWVPALAGGAAVAGTAAAVATSDSGTGGDGAVAASGATGASDAGAGAVAGAPAPAGGGGAAAA